ncbi:ALF repeat-containing protein [Streptomyces sp. NPDC003860]
MGLTRVALTVAATALTPTLLLATPAFAGGSIGAPNGAPVAGAAAAPGPYGCPTAPVDGMSDDDVRVAIARIIGDARTGKAVYAAAQKAMDGTVQDQRYFLETGCWAPQFEDDRVAVFRILGNPTTSAPVRAAAERALEIGTPEALRHFLEYGQYTA